MASCESSTVKLSVDDIFAFSDVELVQYMKQNRRSDGGFCLEVDGWENLPADQRNKLAEILKSLSTSLFLSALRLLTSV
jgi:hypothetical protein